MPVHMTDVIEELRKRSPQADADAVFCAVLNEVQNNYILRRYIAEDWARSFVPVACKVMRDEQLTPDENQLWERYAYAGPVA